MHIASGPKPGALRTDRYPTRFFWVLAAIASLSFLPSLFFYYVGEEGLYTIAAMVMQGGGNPLVPTIPAANYGRPPFQIWLLLAGANVLGWENVLVASRLVAVTGTLLTALMLSVVARELLQDDRFTAFAVLSYLTLFDLLFSRGWLAYSDPVFGCLVFCATGSAWIAARRRAYGLLLAGLAALTLAFLTKALTAYAFYAVAVFVLAMNKNYRSFFLTPLSILFHGLALAFPFVWFFFVPDTSAQGTGMISEITRKFSMDSVGGYLLHLVAFPLETLVRLSPTAALAVYLLWRSRGTALTAAPTDIKLAAWMIALSFLPYWVSPHTHIRYLVPLYPLIAIVGASIVWRSGDTAIRTAVRVAVVIIVAKYIFALVLFPAYQKMYRGENYLLAAKDIMERSRHHALYNTGDTAQAVSIVAYIDSARFPAPPLQPPPANWESGFAIAYSPDPKLGQVAQRYRAGGQYVYLLCRGAACGAASPATQ